MIKQFTGKFNTSEWTISYVAYCHASSPLYRAHWSCDGRQIWYQQFVLGISWHGSSPQIFWIACINISSVSINFKDIVCLLFFFPLYFAYSITVCLYVRITARTHMHVHVSDFELSNSESNQFYWGSRDLKFYRPRLPSVVVYPDVHETWSLTDHRLPSVVIYPDVWGKDLVGQACSKSPALLICHVTRRSSPEGKDSAPQHYEQLAAVLVCNMAVKTWKLAHTWSKNSQIEEHHHIPYIIDSWSWMCLSVCTAPRSHTLIHVGCWRWVLCVH